MIPPPQPPQEATDIFSISDQVLANRLQFIEEIGFGNWGSVWLCRPKPDSASSESPHTLRNSKIAVKLVHRSKTSTTAARVRSLWNEMKVVRSLKQEPHPSIIPFYSFIITPSYALIAMAYHPRLVPVEVPESHAKRWFRSLLSGVEFLHKRGVVHNDIKPANILLSQENVPVLVDFGFAERYDVDSSKAFHSNLSYGTPEYLSPERARGLPHDTRKSDVWSLGVTFFEILVGRTPFEYSEGEQFSTKEDLEKYWSRTLRGKWVGSWKMSKTIEKLLRSMILPNADLRCTATEAISDGYWSEKDSISTLSHRKATSVSHAPSLSLGLEKDFSKLVDVIPPWSPSPGGDKEKIRTDRAKKAEADKENAQPDLRLNDSKTTRERTDRQSSSVQPHHARSRSQPKLQTPEARGISQLRKNAMMPSLLAALSPIKHSPPIASTVIVSSSVTGKENALRPANGKSRSTRKPLGPRSPTPPTSPIRKSLIPMASKENAHAQPPDKDKNARRSRVFKDVTGTNRNVDVPSSVNNREKARDYQKDSVRDRMRAWERERERLREMERLQERIKEVEEERERERREKQMEEEREHQREMERARELQRERERERERELLRIQREEEEDIYPKITIREASTVTPPESILATPLSPLVEEPSDVSWLPNDVLPRSGNESGISILKQSLKMSIDKTVRLYKTSTLALGRSAPALLSTEAADDDDESRMSMSERASWEDDTLIRKVVRHAVRNEDIAAANQLDRMTIWIRNVERVVEDARQNFAASTSSAGPLPTLPVAPISCRTSLSRTNRSSRVPRKILAANQIFIDGFESGSMDQTTTSIDRTSGYFADEKAGSNTVEVVNDTLPTIPSEQPSHVNEVQSLAVPETPSRRRRATVVTRSPEPLRKRVSLEINTDSPSKRREKSKSQNDLARPITPVTKLEFELKRLAMPTRPQRLSAMVDRSLFIASSPASRHGDGDTHADPSQDELTSSPLHIDPYPPKTEASKSSNTLDTPARKHIEGVYDRFLMSTTGVKRLGQGYQSDNAGPILNVPQDNRPVPKRNQKFFHSTRRPMPPPVSSDDLRRATSVDEFGVVIQSNVNESSNCADQGKNTVAIVRKAFRAIVSGKPVSNRLSKAL
ncbi:hypothetical protein AcV7_005759 [Taiwanofungus camphoratus]|nr:hypothetical protein AcV7_005759 [Antrodia cinnamomea]